MNVWVKRLLITIGVMAAALFALIAPIDRTPLREQDFYQKMYAQLSDLKFSTSPTENALKAGWEKINITPHYSMPMAGYTLRDDFESVHDSLYVRIMVLQAGNQPVFMISADLLLFPPVLKKQLEEYYSGEANKPFIYLSATHTHNGIGCWHDTMAGNVILGKYDDGWVTETKNKIVEAIEVIRQNLLPASVAYWETDASAYAENRLKSGAPHDGWLRGIKLSRSDSTDAFLISFSAHPTSISKKSKSLSGDYPAAMIDSLAHKTDSFGMFMAGMVGSHRLTGMSKTEFDLVGEAGELLSEKIKAAPLTMKSDSILLRSAHVPIQFGPSQLRIARNWKLRDWFFSWLINPLQGELTYLQMGNLIMIGTPCDFSGEIFDRHIAEVAALENKKVIITSFNGDYTGYITEDEHYETLIKEEVMALNWVGPYYGTYFSEMITTLLRKD